MNEKIRASDAFRRDQGGESQIALTFPLALSLGCHLVVLFVFVFAPGLSMKTPPPPSVINVSMVSLKTPPKKQATQSAPKQEVRKTVEKQAVKKTPAKKIPVAKKPAPKPKTSLKKKTFKSTEVVKHAIKKLKETKKEKPVEKKEDAASPEQLKSALERLRKEVGKKEADKSAATAKQAASKAADSNAKIGNYSEDGKRKAEMIDLYRLEIAFVIQKNWAFNEALAGGDASLAAAIVFDVMPDGEIRNIFFTDRSGNTYLDESAYKAIVKSSPVDPHPSGLNQPYVKMGIRFTPQGIR